MKKTIATAALLTAILTVSAQGFTLKPIDAQDAQTLNGQVSTTNKPAYLQPGSTAGINPIYYMYIENIKNTTDKINAKDAVSDALISVLTKKVYTDHPGRFPDVEAAIRKSLNGSPRVIIKDFANADEFRQFAAKSDHECILVSGTISGLKTKVDVKEKDNTRGYYATLEGSVTLTNVTSNELITTRIINNSGSSWGTYGTPDNALTEAIGYMRNNLYSYMRATFPITGHILEKGLEKKDKLKQVYIDLGNDWGIGHGQHFHVYVVGSVAGRETKREVGRLKVETVEGTDISLCKVQKGADDIKKAIEGGLSLIVQSYD